MNIVKITLLTILSISLHSSIQGMEMNDKQDQLLKKITIGTYISTIIAERALLASPSFQSLIFGNGPVNEATKNSIQALAHSLTMKSVPNIQEAYPLWHRFASVFSNHSTLFIDPSIDTSTSDSIDSIKRTLIDIKYNRDKNILSAAIVILMIYGTLSTASLLLKKIAPSNNSYLGTIKSGIDSLSQNFKATSLITLVTVFGFIKAQDYYLTTRSF